ncbi:hypothetical protein PT043_08955, partial [Erysipelothrix rhusiopathiae]|nr:hypothetical protein [Erysipelothrix rhusiopathiae]
KRVQQSILDALEEERIPWESPVTKNFMVPINAITNKQYHNVKNISLTLWYCLLVIALMGTIKFLVTGDSQGIRSSSSASRID